MFVLTISRSSSNMGHVVSKNRSLGQIFENPCVHNIGVIFHWIFVKLLLGMTSMNNHYYHYINHNKIHKNKHIQLSGCPVWRGSVVLAVLVIISLCLDVFTFKIGRFLHLNTHEKNFFTFNMFKNVLTFKVPTDRFHLIPAGTYMIA